MLKMQSLLFSFFIIKHFQFLDETKSSYEIKVISGSFLEQA